MNTTLLNSNVTLNLNSTPECECEIEKLYPDLQDNGLYRPPNCTAAQRVAILVPYRDRENHLKLFLKHMHSFLQAQHIEYRIFIIEQVKVFLLKIGEILVKFDLFRLEINRSIVVNY